MCVWDYLVIFLISDSCVNIVLCQLIIRRSMYGCLQIYIRLYSFCFRFLLILLFTAFVCYETSPYIPSVPSFRYQYVYTFDSASFDITASLLSGHTLDFKRWRSLAMIFTRLDRVRPLYSKLSPQMAWTIKTLSILESTLANDSLKDAYSLFRGWHSIPMVYELLSIKGD